MKTFTCRLLVTSCLAPHAWRVSEVRILCWAGTLAATAVVGNGRAGVARAPRDRHSAEIHFTGDPVDAAGDRREVEKGIEGRVPKTASELESVGAGPHPPPSVARKSWRAGLAYRDGGVWACGEFPNLQDFQIPNSLRTSINWPR